MRWQLLDQQNTSSHFTSQCLTSYQQLTLWQKMERDQWKSD